MATEDTTRPPARRRGRPPKGEGPPTPERLLDAALELFAQQGYAATTVRQIGEAAGVRDSAIYGHFPGKQAIYDALLAQAGPLSLPALGIDPDALAAADPREAIPELVERVLASWETPRARCFASVLLREGAGATGMGGLAAAITDARDRLEPVFRGWQDAGLLRADLSARQLAWELFAPLHVARFLHLRAGDHTDPAAARALATDHVAFFLACVTPPTRSETRCTLP